jgi:2,3-bisphosphoglycerate-independent phosphoglycerate mutase
VADDRMRGKKLRQNGRLPEVAPTALHIMGIENPAEMTERSLIVD